MQMPKNGDAYNEIYIIPDWYGLAPDPSLLDPAGIVQKRLEKNGGNKTVLGNFKDNLSLVVNRQWKIRNIHHKSTYAAYNGNGDLKQNSKASAATESSSKNEPGIEKGLPLEELLTWGKVFWTGNVPQGGRGRRVARCDPPARLAHGQG
jgi:hypothetical protein